MKPSHALQQHTYVVTFQNFTHGKKNTDFPNSNLVIFFLLNSEYITKNKSKPVILLREQ